jgi:PII interaction protein X
VILPDNVFLSIKATLAKIKVSTLMTNETYLNHPNFGLLYRVCLLDNSKELYTTLYAQRLFFIVSVSSNVVNFEPVSRSDGRTIVETRLRHLRRLEATDDYLKLQQIYKQTFQ